MKGVVLYGTGATLSYPYCWTLTLLVSWTVINTIVVIVLIVTLINTWYTCTVIKIHLYY